MYESANLWINLRKGKLLLIVLGLLLLLQLLQPILVPQYNYYYYC